MKMKTQNSSRILLWLLFLLYALLMLWLLYGQRAGSGYDRAELWNPVPFSTVGRYFADLAGTPVTSDAFRTAVVQIFGNIGMFVPFGFFLPALFRRQRRFFIFLPTAVITDILIEGMQLALCLGFCEADDLLLNIPGMCIGWLLYTAAAICTGRKMTETDKKQEGADRT